MQTEHTKNIETIKNLQDKIRTLNETIHQKDAQLSLKN